MLLTLKLSKPQLQTIQTQAEQTYPQECCGLLLGHQDRRFQTCIEIWPTQNQWDSAQDHATNPLTDTTKTALQGARNPVHGRHDRFWIDPKDILRAQKYSRDRQLGIIGVYHSHPDNPAHPSDHDLYSAWSEYAYLIISVHNGKAVDYRSWVLVDSEPMDLEAVDLEPMNLEPTDPQTTNLQTLNLQADEPQNPRSEQPKPRQFGPQPILVVP